MPRLLLAALAVLGLAGTAGSARASTIFDLTGDHCTGGCGAAPFGSITLTQNGANVDVTVHLLSPNMFVRSGAVDFQAFKFNATGVVVGDITVDQTVSGQTLAAQTGAFNGNGTGSFVFGIACTTCGGGSSDKFDDDIVFHVANATISDLIAPNSLGNLFVADVLGTTGNTGPVYAVPEPATAALFGLGLLGLAAAGRRQRGRS